MRPLSESARRFQEAMRQQGHELDIVTLSTSTRTAREAAHTIGCEVAQIAKSIVFCDGDRDRPVVVIASGANRVSLKKVAALTRSKLQQADGNFVKKRVGYAIGGVPPARHKSETTLLLDRDLRGFDEIRAAGGTPNTVFRVTPDALPMLTGGEWCDIAEDQP